MKRVAIVAFLILVVPALVSCKSSEAPPPPPGASAQPPMPTGMLAAPPPQNEGPATPPAAAQPGVAKSLRSVREATTGEWIEIQPAPEGESPKKTTFQFFKRDSLFIPLDAMSLLHDSFAQALPGFALFTPQLFAALQLGDLKTRLREFKRLWSSIPTAAQARQRFPYSARVKIALTDDLWRDFQAELVFTIDEIVNLADAQVKKGDGLWVLTTQGH